MKCSGGQENLQLVQHKGSNPCFTLLGIPSIKNLEPQNWIKLINLQVDWLIDYGSRVQPRVGNKIKNGNYQSSHSSGSGMASSICGCLDHVQDWLLEWEQHATDHPMYTLTRHWHHPSHARFMKSDTYCPFKQLMRWDPFTSQGNKDNSVTYPQWKQVLLTHLGHPPTLLTVTGFLEPQ